MALCNTCVNHNNCDGCRRFEETYKEEPSACSGYEKRKTHADLVRAMTDEELAKFIASQRTDCYHCPVVVCVDACEVSWLDWLKKEAAE